MDSGTNRASAARFGHPDMAAITLPSDPKSTAFRDGEEGLDIAGNGEKAGAPALLSNSIPIACPWLHAASATQWEKLHSGG